MICLSPFEFELYRRHLRQNFRSLSVGEYFVLAVLTLAAC